MQLAMMVARIMYSKGVQGLRTGQEDTRRQWRPTAAQDSSQGQAISRGLRMASAEPIPPADKGWSSLHPAPIPGGSREAGPLQSQPSPSTLPGGRQHH
jgi:hypothetical protein